MLAPAVSITGLVVRYGGRVALDGVDLEVGGGRVTAVLGPNGAGKTTMVEVCEGLRPADSGTVRVLGLPPNNPALRPRVGVMLQDGGGYATARPVELLSHFARMYRSPQSAAGLADALGLTGAAPYRRLSGGERARLNLGLALIGRPELLFLDEPGAGLDLTGREVLWDLVRAARAQGATVVLTTHSFEEAQALADDVVILADGTVRAEGPLVRLAPPDRVVVRFRARPGVRLPPPAPGVEVSELVPGEYRAAGQVSAATVAAVADWAQQAGEPITDLSLGNPGLSDLYRTLTDDRT